jgi:hypothetical protein
MILTPSICAIVGIAKTSLRPGRRAEEDPSSETNIALVALFRGRVLFPRCRLQRNQHTADRVETRSHTDNNRSCNQLGGLASDLVHSPRIVAFYN